MYQQKRSARTLILVVTIVGAMAVLAPVASFAGSTDITRNAVFFQHNGQTGVGAPYVLKTQSSGVTIYYDSNGNPYYGGYSYPYYGGYYGYPSYPYYGGYGYPYYGGGPSLGIGLGFVFGSGSGHSHGWGGGGHGWGGGGHGWGGGGRGMGGGGRHR